MGTLQNLELTLKQKLNISNKIITTLQIMTLNILELQSFLEKESEDNVFIDYDCFFEDKLFRNYIKNKVHKEKFVFEKEDIEDIEKDRYEPTLTEILLEQLGTFVLDEEEKNIGEIIIYSLDKDGYLRDNIDEIADITHQDVKKIKKILKIIQTFEPVGIGARNLQECLLLQTQDDFVKKINSFLPKDIAIHHFHKVKDDAHARFDATERTYKYYINFQKNPFLYEFSYYLYQKLDVSLLNEACEILKQYSDFQCFSKTKTDVKTYICDIKNAFWEEKDNQLIFTITADRFLRNMVRAIVGTMLNIGTKKINLTDFRAIIESKNRGLAGFSVPANALFLVEVKYPSEIFIN